MKIPFDIKYRPQIERGEYKVFLANGNTVRILAWDLPGDYPIAAADWPSNDETDTRVETYTEEGWDGIGEKTCNFVLVSSSAYLDLDTVKEWSHRFHPDIREEIENTAYHFWNLAISELRADIEFRGEEYKKGYEDGKSEAEKDLPRWKKCGKDTVRTFGDEHFEYRCGCGYLVMNRREILLSDLEKLPGFKEGK